MRPAAATLLALSLMACRTPAETRVHPIDGLIYVWIPPGEFPFGCSPGDKECYQWEPPAQPRQIKTGFWIGQTEVTQRAYKYVLGSNPSLYPGDSRPVDSVSWNDAQRYCRELGLRLPAAVEWEYAARGATVGPRYGSVNEIAWFDANSGDTSHAAQQKQPNAFGLHDMLGNMWEWVYDPWTADTIKDQRQLRGGAFTGLAKDIRASNLNWAPPGTAHRNMGFRCAANSLP